MATSCSHCLAPLPPGERKKCGGCRLSYYCGIDCQRAHRPVHAAKCKEIEAERTAAGEEARLRELNGKVTKDVSRGIAAAVQCMTPESRAEFRKLLSRNGGAGLIQFTGAAEDVPTRATLPVHMLDLLVGCIATNLFGTAPQSVGGMTFTVSTISELVDSTLASEGAIARPGEISREEFVRLLSAQPAVLVQSAVGGRRALAVSGIQYV